MAFLTGCGIAEEEYSEPEPEPEPPKEPDYEFDMEEFTKEIMAERDIDDLAELRKLIKKT